MGLPLSIFPFSDYRLVLLAVAIGCIVILIKFTIPKINVALSKIPIPRLKKLLWLFLPKIKPLQPFVDRIFDYVLAICVAFISFYSANLLSLKKTSDEQKTKSEQLLKHAISRCKHYEFVIKRYAAYPEFSTNAPYQPSDSEIISRYYIYSTLQPFYLTDAVSPTQTLAFISATGYNVLSVLEGNEQIALKIVRDTSVSFYNRHKTLNAVQKFDSLRRVLLELEYKTLMHNDSFGLAKVQDSINCVNSNFILTLWPRAYNTYWKSDSDRVLNYDGSLTHQGCQNNEWPVFDSLRKYAYLLRGISKGQDMDMATCFFVRKSQHLYLVSTYSIFTGWNTMSDPNHASRVMPALDSVKIRLIRSDNGQEDYVSISLAKIRDTSKMQYCWDKPSLYLYELSDQSIQKKYTIYSLEALIDVYSIKYGTPDDVYFPAYSGTLFKPNGNYSSASPTVYKTTMIGQITDKPEYPDDHKIDSLNYHIDTFTDAGSRGAPVFFKVSVPKGNENIDVITFGGVCFADTRQHKARIVRTEQVINILKHLH